MEAKRRLKQEAARATAPVVPAAPVLKPLSEEQRAVKFVKKKQIRNVVTKLELPQDEETQQKKIAKSLFDTEIHFAGPAADSSAWRTTDDYFTKAKTAYDSVVAPFSKPPHVYKLDTVNRRQEEHEASSSPAKAVTTADERAVIPLDIDLELDTMLDPHALPKPWVIKYDRDDNLYYFNEVTKAKKIARPDDVSHSIIY